jgi:hypothetical protein
VSKNRGGNKKLGIPKKNSFNSLKYRLFKNGYSREFYTSY